MLAKRTFPSYRGVRTMAKPPIDTSLEQRKLELEERKFEKDNEFRKLELEARARENDTSLDQKKLALEERKLDSDDQIRKVELEIKARESGWFARLASPLTAPIIAGVLALFASIAGIFFQGRQTLELEKEKFGFSKEQETQKQRQTLELEREKFGFSKEQETQKEQHELILKMISVGDVKQARSNLEFLAETGLLADKALAERILQSKTTPVLPVPLASGTDPVLKCDTGAPNASRSGVVQIADVQLYVESCVFLVPGGPSGYYRYNYRLENKGSKSVAQVFWAAAGITVSSLPPGQPYTSTSLLNSPPRVVNTDIFFNEASKGMVEAVVPSQTPTFRGAR
jgi:hypothetical protein